MSSVVASSTGTRLPVLAAFPPEGCQGATARLPFGAGGLLAARLGQHAVLVGLLAVRARLRLSQHLVDDQAGALADRLLDRMRNLRVLLQERLGVLAPLADAVAVIGEPGARLLDDVGLDA